MRNYLLMPMYLKAMLTSMKKVAMTILVLMIHQRITTHLILTPANARSMFINNDSGLALYTASDYMNCIFWEQAITAKEDKEKVEFIYTPYLRNTLGYFQVHVFEETYGLVKLTN